MSGFNVRFGPDDITVSVSREQSILEAAVQAGIFIKSSCGGNGSCSQCKVLVKKGSVHTGGEGKLTLQEIEEGYVLACQAYPESDIEVEIPETSRLSEHKILVSEAEDFRAPVNELDPLFKKVKLELAEPALDDPVDDVSRLYAALQEVTGDKSLQMDVQVMQRLPYILRQSEWKVTAALAEMKNYVEVLNVEPGWNYGNYYGLALDIGTTTVVAHLVDLESGESVNVEGTYNRQSTYGDDVISRIVYAAEEDGGLEKLQYTIVETVNALIAKLIKEKKVERKDIGYATCAGNTAMVHLFLGIIPDYIRLEPYVPAVNYYTPFDAKKVGIRIHPNGKIYCLPGVASFVGADITAGAKTIGIDRQDKITLFIDVGTNGELVLGNRDFLVTCACSAGPAFEGVGITHGMRAMDGAIENIRIMPGTQDIYCQVIGNKKPLGICGSGLISCIAALREAEIIDRGGAFQANVQERMRETEGDQEFVLVPAGESGTGRDITISESEIKTLIHSKAAIFAGIETMLKLVEMPLEAIEQIYIAGGFGKHINIGDAIRIGMFPDLPLDKYKYIGNSSITGAKMVLLSREARKEVEALAGQMTYLELSTGNDFMEEFVSASFIPHTDRSLFPHIA